jgi:hypothetical protein
MATPSLPTPQSRTARSPFLFNSACHLLRIGTERAHNLAELLQGLHSCPEASIFQHMFQTLQEHHYIREGFSNDFAHWAFFACNETTLAEQLSGIDAREFTSVRSMREQVIKIVENYIKQNPRAGERAALEPFYFCSAETVVVPTSCVARNLQEFADGLSRVTLHSIHFHFINARLRIKLNSNDFSMWLQEELEMPRLADRINRIDIYTSTLEGVRRSIIDLVNRAAAAPEKSGKAERAA